MGNDKFIQNVFNIIQKKREERDHSEDLGTDGKVILDWILGKQGGKVWTGFIRLRTGTTGRSCERRTSYLRVS
jgi:hypothetical protein